MTSNFPKSCSKYFSLSEKSNLTSLDPSKQQVIQHLNYCYCRIQRSPLHGVGVFAIREIGNGVNPFKGSYVGDQGSYFTKDELHYIHPNIHNMFKDYWAKSDSGKQYIPKFANMPIWTNYLNHAEGDKANLILTNDGQYLTTKLIKPGEELLEDYNQLYEIIHGERKPRYVKGRHPDYAFFN